MDRFNDQEKLAINKMLDLASSERAQAIAEMVHAKQKDKAGADYIDHPRRVAENARRNMRALTDRYTEEEIELVRQAAWLHDVLEDSGKNGFSKVKAADLEAWGIDKKVIELVEVVTKTDSPEESVEHRGPSLTPTPYYIAIKASPLGRVLKIADITDNHNLDRHEALEKLGGSSKVFFYKKAIDFLGLDKHERPLFEKRINLPAELTDQEWADELLVDDWREPNSWEDASTEDYYIRNLNSGMSDAAAYAKAEKSIRYESLALSYRNMGYSVRRATAKADEAWKKWND